MKKNVGWIVVLLGALNVAPVAVAQPGQSNEVRLTLRDVGPETGFSGSGSGFTFNPDTNQVILPTQRRMFRSANSGSTWSPLYLAMGDPNDLTNNRSTEGSYFVRQDPRNPEVLHAVGATSGRLARSSDFGTTWTQQQDPRLFNFADIAVDETSSNVVLALRKVAYEFEGPALWRSENGGATFMPQWSAGLPVAAFDPETEEECDPFFSNIVTTPADPSVVYVVQQSGSPSCPDGIHKSVDGGRTFGRLSSWRGGAIQVFAHPTLPGVLFVQTHNPFNSSLHRSRDGGATFQLVAAGLPSQNFFVSFDDSNPSHVYVAGRSGVFRSRDGGDTFSPLGLTADQVGRFAANVNVDPTNSNVIYVNTWNGNFQSDNGGRTFGAINNGWKAAIIRAIAFDHASEPNLYLATDHGIYRTHTRGHDFERVPHPSELDDTVELVVAPSDPSVMLAVTLSDDLCCAPALYRTIDAGASWSRVSVGDGDEAPAVVSPLFDPQDSRKVYLAAQFPCVFDDNGPGECLNNPLDGLYKSIDAGATFQLIFQTSALRSLTIDPVHPNVIFNAVGHCPNGCYYAIGRSIDGGVSFPQIPGATLFDFAATATVLIDPHTPNNMFLFGGYFTTEEPAIEHSVVRSTDGGTTFQPAEAAGLAGGCYLAVMDPKDSTRLFCVSNGVYVTSDSAETWTSTVSDEIATLQTRSVLIDPKRPKLLYVLGGSLLEVEVHSK